MTIAERIADRARQEGLELYFGLPGSGALMDLMEAGRTSAWTWWMGHDQRPITAAYYGPSRRRRVWRSAQGAGAGNLAAGASTPSSSACRVCCASASRRRARRDAAVCAQERVRPVSNAARDRRRRRSGHTTTPPSPPPRRTSGAALLQLASTSTERSARSHRSSERAVRTAAGRRGDPHAARRSAAGRRRSSSWGRTCPGGASGAVRALVDRLRPAVLHGFHARGMVPEDDPRFAGVFMAFPGPNILANRILAEADGALLIGVDGLSVEGTWDTALGIPTCELAARPEFEIVSPATVRVDAPGRLAAGLDRRPGRRAPTRFPAGTRGRHPRRHPGALLRPAAGGAPGRAGRGGDRARAASRGRHHGLGDRRLHRHARPPVAGDPAGHLLRLGRRADDGPDRAGGAGRQARPPGHPGARHRRRRQPADVGLGELETLARTGSGGAPSVSSTTRRHGTIRSAQKTAGSTPIPCSSRRSTTPRFARGQRPARRDGYDPETLRPRAGRPRWPPTSPP